VYFAHRASRGEDSVVRYAPSEPVSRQISVAVVWSSTGVSRLRNPVGHLLEAVDPFFNRWVGREHLAHLPTSPFRAERLQRIGDEQL